jgi:catechol 2,3-dioxygenase-like lactoylglutathione lyase family enzyme
MRFGHIELFVSDPPKARQFYEAVLGFEVVDVQSDAFVWLKMGDIEILLRRGTPPPAAPDYGSAASAIVFYTDDLHQTVNLLRSRGLVFDGFDGTEDCPTFTDPDRNWFQLASPG